MEATVIQGVRTLNIVLVLALYSRSALAVSVSVCVCMYTPIRTKGTKDVPSVYVGVSKHTYMRTLTYTTSALLQNGTITKTASRVRTRVSNVE